MAFARQPLVHNSFAVGIQTVNQTRNNQDTIASDYNARHVQSDGERWGRMGHHDDPLIARYVARCIPQTLNGNTFLVLPMGSGLNYYRVGTGQWVFSFAGGRFAGARADAIVTGTELRQVVCSTLLVQAVGKYSWTVAVSTWDLATPALTDFEFTLQIWSMD